LMQCCDVFFLKADICQLGLDQRKVNALARDYCQATKRKFRPVILSNHMLYGLKAGQEKMSKSDPDSAIFMEDSAEDVEWKIRQAYCPSQEEVVEHEFVVEEPEDAGKASMHIKTDTLKNPILDYIENILMSREGATFLCNGVVYKEFALVRAAFLGGDISEDALKDALITALNELLEPVRQHFSNDPAAADLLVKVIEYKKLGKDSATKTIRRLDLVAQSKVLADSHLVFCPMPSKRPTLQEALDVLYGLRCSSPGRPAVLMLQDWSAMVCNALESTKAIDACFDVMLGVLRSLDASFMENVTILRQSECTLLDPSNYWISVINVGRKFSLAQVMGDDLVDMDGVGNVIHRLMSVADVTSIQPASWVAASTVVCDLVREFLPDQNVGVPEALTVQVPNVRLHQIRPKGEEQDVDEYFLLDGAKEHAKSKLKKSFAEEKNIEFCPALQLAKVFCFPDPLVVTRSDDNGGTVTYDTYEHLVADYESGALHPGDLKNGGLAPIMLKVFENIQTELKPIQQSVKILKAEAKSKK
jgi:tyrosyl-tRNA synthetase